MTARYRVFEPPVVDGAPQTPSERAVFVRDAFAGWAFLFPGVWLLRHGLIVAGLVALGLSAGFGALAERPGLGLAGMALSLLLGLLVALEGPSLRAGRYRRKGYAEAATIHAGHADDAAIVYYAGSQTATGAPATPAPAASPLARPAQAALPPRSRTLLDPQGMR